MHVDSPTSSPDIPPTPAPQPSSAASSSGRPPTATWSTEVARVDALEGTLIAVGVSDIAVELAAGDGVGEGDILVAGAGTRARIVFADGATATITGAAKVEVHGEVHAGQGDDDGGGAIGGRIDLHVGSLAVDTTADAEARLVVEAGAAAFAVDDAALAVTQARPGGLEAVLLSAGADGNGAVTVVNDSGDFVLRQLHAPIVVESWRDAPRPTDAAQARADVEDAAPATAGGDAAPDVPAGAYDGASAPDAQAVDTPFETGAGTASPGDSSFVFPEPFRPGLADHPVMADAFAARLPSVSSQIPPPPPPGGPEAFSSAGHAADALFLYRAPVETALPSAQPPTPALPPRLSGWETSGHFWDIAGVAASSSGDRELPAYPDRAFALITPVDGQTMAMLEPRHAYRDELERFLGLPDFALNSLVDGTHVANGSAIRTQYSLQAGQTLSFNVLFDAIDMLPLDDYAAFTVSDGDRAEAFVISTVSTTGNLGVTPWQTLHYTAGQSGSVTVGFVVVNDTTINGLSRLYVDDVSATGGGGEGGGDAYELVAGRDDAFGGRFELLTPKSGGDGGEQLLASFETRFGLNDRIGSATTAEAFTEPDGAHGVYAPTDGTKMAVLRAFGAHQTAIGTFLGLTPEPGNVFALPSDIDGSTSASGAATRLSLSAAAGDRVSFDWMFDAGGQLPDNDYAVFTVADADGSHIFKLSDLRQTGEGGASGWRTSVYTVAEDSELTLGFAVVNDRLGGYSADDSNSRLLVDNVRLNRDFGEGYQLADHPAPGALDTLADA